MTRVRTRQHAARRGTAAGSHSTDTRSADVAPADDWAARAACRDADPESLFVSGAAQHKAKLICSGCTVRIDCLADALDSRTEFGVWGGLTERERRMLLRLRPDVQSWRRVLAAHLPRD